MITITRTDNKNYHRIEISGHSGYAQSGTDIVCAGVSALSHAYVLQIDRLHQEKQIDDAEILLADGYTLISYKDKNNICEPIRRMYYEGLESIEEVYGDYVFITYSHNEKIF